MPRLRPYIPALSFRWLTPLYDLVTPLLLPEIRGKRQLVAAGDIEPGSRLLDVGCGTGTLAIMLMQANPGAEVIGLDVDPGILARARVKAARAGTDVRFEQGIATRLPYHAGSFDRVFSSLVFHHLEANDKRLALRECRRVLRPDGRLLLLDFGPPHGLVAKLLGLVLVHLERARDNYLGLIPIMMREAGFTDVAETAAGGSALGSIVIYRGLAGAG